MPDALKKHDNNQAPITHNPVIGKIGGADDARQKVQVRSDTSDAGQANVGIGKDDLDNILRNINKTYGPMLERLAKK